MDAFGLLQTMAQIGVAIAGFGAVASSLAIRAEAGKVDASRLTIMMFGSLMMVIGALMPCGLALSPLAEEWRWRAPAIVVVVANAYVVSATVQRVKRIGRLPVVTLVLQFALHLTASAAFLLCAFGIPAGNLALSYFAGLFATLVSVCLSLYLVAYAMLGSAKPD